MQLILKSLILLLTATLILACATPSPQELANKTDVSIIDRASCVSDVAELDMDSFLELQYENITSVVVDENSQCILVEDNPTYLAGFKLPIFEGNGYGLQLESRLVKTVMLFLPNAYLVDSSKKIVREINADQYKYRSSKWETTVFINDNSADAKYLIFFTDPSSIGEGEKRRTVDTSTTYNGYGGYWTSGVDKEKQIIYTTQGTIAVLPIKN